MINGASNLEIIVLKFCEEECCFRFSVIAVGRIDLISDFTSALSYQRVGDK